MKRTQFGEKVMALGYHVNEMNDHATIWKEGNYICKVPCPNREYEIPCHHKYMIPDEIKELIYEYGKN